MYLCILPNTMQKTVEGFSKLTKAQKIDWVAKNCTSNPESTKNILAQYLNSD